MPDLANINFKDSAKLSLVNFCSRIFGFGREMLKAYVFGTSAVGDAFQIAFTIPNLFRRLTAEGALLSTFIPHLSTINKEDGPEVAKDFFFSVFWTLLAFLGLFYILFIAGTDFLVTHIFASGFDPQTLKLTITLTRITFIYIVFISLAALFQGILNVHGKYVLPACTPIILNCSIVVVGLYFYYYFNQPAFGFAAGVVIGGFLQMAILVPPIIKLGYSFLKRRYSWKKFIKKMLPDIAPGTIGAGIYQIDIVISNAIASHLPAGAIISLNFSNRLLELALGVFVVAQTTVLLPSLSARINAPDKAEIKKSVMQALTTISYIMLPISVGMMITAEDIIRILFGYGKFNNDSIQLTSSVLTLHLIGMLAISWNRVLITAYQAAKKFSIIMRFAFICMLSNISLALYFSTKIGVPGIALASSLSQIILCGFFIFFLFRQTALKLDWKELLSKSLLKQFIAVSIMGAATYSIQLFNWQSAFTKFTLQVSFGIFIYLAVSHLLKIDQLYIILNIFKRKKHE